MTTAIKNLNNKFMNTRFFFISVTDTANDIRDNLNDKLYDPDMYGTVYAYFMSDNDVDMLANIDKNNEAKVKEILDRKCEFGFEILDMNLRERNNGETPVVKMDINTFSNLDNVDIQDCNNVGLSEGAAFIKKMSKAFVGC